MLSAIFQILERLDALFWGYVAFALIVVLGSYLTFKCRLFQVRALPIIGRIFVSSMKIEDGKQRGVHPLKAFFASAGGMIGIGNVAGIVTAVQLGGPGALFWVWIAGLIGAIVKYGEVYLGIKYREPNDRGGYDGGPMYYLKVAFKSSLLPIIMAGLLCIYGIEIYQFSVVTESISTNWGLSRPLVIGAFLALVLYGSMGGVKRLGKICSWVMPFFVIAYVGMCLWVVLHEAAAFPGVIGAVFRSAFTGHAAVGGFAGSTMLFAVQHGLGRAAYSGDIGIGYDSIIQSEASTPSPSRQGGLAILGVFVDNVICTMSILVVLVTGVWSVPIQGSHLVQSALSLYFPHMELFMPLFLVICGYTTIIAYFVTGIKCARYLSPRRGAFLYGIYGVISLILFTFVSQGHALLVMSVAGSMLLIFNMLGIFKLRGEISFSLKEKEVLSGVN